MCCLFREREREERTQLQQLCENLKFDSTHHTIVENITHIWLHSVNQTTKTTTSTNKIQNTKSPDHNNDVTCLNSTYYSI